MTLWFRISFSLPFRFSFFIREAGYKRNCLNSYHYDVNLNYEMICGVQENEVVVKSANGFSEFEICDESLSNVVIKH